MKSDQKRINIPKQEGFFEACVGVGSYNFPGQEPNLKEFQRANIAYRESKAFLFKLDYYDTHCVSRTFEAYRVDAVDNLDVIGSIVEPHPFPVAVRNFQAEVDRESKERFAQFTEALSYYDNKHMNVEICSLQAGMAQEVKNMGKKLIAETEKEQYKIVPYPVTIDPLDYLLAKVKSYCYEAIKSISGEKTSIYGVTSWDNRPSKDIEYMPLIIKASIQETLQEYFPKKQEGYYQEDKQLKKVTITNWISAAKENGILEWIDGYYYIPFNDMNKFKKQLREWCDDQNVSIPSNKEIHRKIHRFTPEGNFKKFSYKYIQNQLWK